MNITSSRTFRRLMCILTLYVGEVRLDITPYYELLLWDYIALRCVTLPVYMHYLPNISKL